MSQEWQSFIVDLVVGDLEVKIGLLFPVDDVVSFEKQVASFGRRII